MILQTHSRRGGVAAEKVVSASRSAAAGVRCLLILAVWLAVFAGAARAQTYYWRNVEIGGGGFVTGIAFHPTTPNLVYARTDVGGAYRLDPATSRWIALNDEIGGVNNEFQHLGVLSVGLDPSDSNKLYLATGQYGGAESWKLVGRFYRSSDRGATWNYVTLSGATISGTTAFGGVKFAGNGEGRGAGEIIAVDPANGSKIVIGSSGEGLWRSANGGSNWARLTSFDTFGTTSYGINFVMYAPAAAGTNLLYAAAKVTTEGPSLWRSTDGGTTWTAVPNQPGRVAGSEMFAIQGAFDAAGVFYMTWADETGPANYATHYEVWKLAADGVTWTKITPPTGQGFFAGVSADPRVAGHVLVTTLQRWYPGDEVYRSTNGGATWTGVLRSGTRSVGNSPWSSSAGAHWMTDIAIDPFNSDRAIFNNGFGLISTTNLSAPDASRSWTFFSDGLEELVPLDLLSPTAGPPLISVTGDYTGYRHDDLARSPLRGRHVPGNGSNNVVSGADLAPAKMIRQNSDDTYFSQDAGASWAAFPAVPSPTINGAGRVVLSTGGQRLVWCPSGSPAYFSADDGNTWTVSTGGSGVNATGQLAIKTLAGALGIPGMVNSTGGNARFNSPAAVAVGSTGIRYVADTGNHLIRKIAGNESVSTLAGTPGVAGSADTSGAVAAKFSSPAGIVVSGGNIFVADTGNHTIRKVTGAGAVTTFSGAAGIAGAIDGTGTGARFSSPTGLGADGAGNLYVADTGNHGIRKIASNGDVTTLAGALGIAGSANLTGTAAQFNAPKGVAVDASGNVYVADTGNHVIRKITVAGAVSTFAGGMGTSGSVDGTGTGARFNLPGSIAIDGAGVLYVADTGNNGVRKITPAGVVTTVAGAAAGAVDGTGSAARFQSPTGIAVDAGGVNIYVADATNHAIRKGTVFYNLIPLADRVDDQRFYLWDNTNKKLLTSTDGGASFSAVATGVNSAFAAYATVPGKSGHIWVRAGSSGLHQSSNFGATFTKITSVAEAYMFGFGKAAPSGSYPAIFLWGKVSGVVGFFRSDNAGASWVRINDNLHQFGYINVLTGDPRVYGRVYLGTSGRGVIVGDLPATPPPSLPTQIIYDDALRNAWTNASPSGTTLGSNSPVRRGTGAISVASGTSRAVSFSSAARSTAGFAALSFWITSGTATPPPLRVSGSRGGIALEAVPVTAAAGGGWQRILLPLAQLGLSNIDDLTGIRIESTGTSPGAFSVDDVALVGADDFNNSSSVSLTLAGLSATYDGTSKSVAVTTTPSGKPVAVTYNGSSSAPTAAGSYAVAAFVDDPLSTGSAAGTLVIAKASASVLLGNLATTADGAPKLVTVATTPPGLAVSVTYNDSATPPTYAGSYNVIATITDANFQGSSSATLVIRQAALSATGLAGWSSNNPAAAPTPITSATSSPLLNPDNIASGAGAMLQAYFSPITLANAGDKITLTGTVTLSAAGISNQANWLRFGLYDNRGQAQNVYTGWLGYSGMGSSLWERVNNAVAGLYPTGFDAVQRIPNSTPTPVSGNSPSGTPTIYFEENITRTGTGVDVVYVLKRLDTNATLMSYTYSDTSPNNNGIVTGENTAVNTGYSPTYNAAGFMFGSTYIGTSTASAQYSNVQLSFTPGVTAGSQFITFAQPADRAVNSAPTGLSATASSGLPVTFAIVSGPATISGGTTVTVTGTGSVVVRASQSGNVNYLPAPEVEQTFNVTKAAGTVTLSNVVATYDGTAKAASATTSPPGLAVDVTYNGGATPPTNAGSYPVVATINDATYQGIANGTLLISRGTQVISFGAPPPRTFGDAPFALSGTADSGLPLSFSVVSGPATVSGSMVTLTGAGTVVVRASQGGSANILAAPDVDRSFTVSKATAAVTLGNLTQMFDGQPKPVTFVTVPAGLMATVTYNGSTSLPVATGSYAVVATVNNADYQGSVSGTLVINRRTITSELTSWMSNIVGKVSWDVATPSSPLLNPDDPTDASSTNTLQAAFAPITMATGDKIVLTGSFQMTATPVSGQGNWFRFGVYDRLNQPLSNSTGWLGLTGMGNSLYERTAANGLFSTGTGATQRAPDGSPSPISSTSPAGNPLLAFEVTITRTATGIVVTHLLSRTDTNATLMSYSYTDTTPNNNGLLTGAQSSPTSPAYNPTFNTAGFSFAKSYIGGTGAKAQFYNMQLAYTPALDGSPQSITFAPIADRTFNDAPFALSATASSGLPVSFSVVSGPATLNVNTLTITGAGTVTVRASQAGSYTFLPAVPLEQSFDVSKATAVITLSNLNATYNGSVKEAAVATSPANLLVVTTYGGSLNAPWDVGNYAVLATVEDDNYQGSSAGTLTINPANQQQNWRYTYFGTAANTGIASDGFDANDDGESNLLEFATAQNPASATRATLAVARNGANVDFTYTRSLAAMGDGVTFVVEWRDSLAGGAWSSAGVSEQILSDNGIVQSVNASVPAGAGAGRFFHLKISKP